MLPPTLTKPNGRGTWEGDSRWRKFDPPIAEWNLFAIFLLSLGMAIPACLFVYRMRRLAPSVKESASKGKLVSNTYIFEDYFYSGRVYFGSHDLLPINGIDRDYFDCDNSCLTRGFSPISDELHVLYDSNFEFSLDVASKSSMDENTAIGMATRNVIRNINPSEDHYIHQRANARVSKLKSSELVRSTVSERND